VDVLIFASFPSDADPVFLAKQLLRHGNTMNHDMQAPLRQAFIVAAGAKSLEISFHG
jgi:hypothetical protein